MTSANPILALWSSPRSRSTAFFRAMLERGDVHAVHEPFGSVLDRGWADVGGERVDSVRAVVARLRELAADKPVFFKDTCEHDYLAAIDDHAFLFSDVTHAFLIRDPAAIVASYFALQPAMTVDDVGLVALQRLHSAVSGAGRPAMVIDADDLVAAPEASMASYWSAVGLPSRPDAIRWSTGDRPEWAATSRWHRRVASTTGFDGTPSRYAVTAADSAVLRGFVEHHLTAYRELSALCVRPPNPTPRGETVAAPA